MARHTMIDIETLGVDPDAVILTIGAQGFDPYSTRYTDVTFYQRLDLESQHNRSICDQTVEWWGKQGAAAQEEALGDSVPGNPRNPIGEVLKDLHKLLWQTDEIWANGTTFDMTILEHAFKQNGFALPWKYWTVSDARTIYKLVPQVGKLGNNHNALADCVNQIDMLQQAFQILDIGNI